MSYPVTRSGRVILDSAVHIKTRLAQGLDKAFIVALSRVCELLQPITSCFLLEAKFPDDPEVKLLVVPTMPETNEAQETEIFSHFQETLRAFPDLARRTFILLDNQIVEKYAGSEFYKRPAN